MEAVTAGVAGAGVGTGSKTIADLLPLAVEKYGDAPAQRHKVGDAWVDISYAELGRAVREIALGLVDLGIEPGDKVAILANTRPEWTSACFGILTAGGALVTIYQTNSAEECQYVLAHSDSRRCSSRTPTSWPRSTRSATDCPELQHVIVMDPGDAELDDELSLDALRERGAGRDEAEWRQRYEAVTPDDVCLFIYTSGTTGPPKGCLLSHGNYRAITDAVIKDSVLEDGDSAYLFLPLAHAFAILIQFTRLRAGRHARLLVAATPKQIIPDLTEVKPSFFPSVPRMFEKIYTLATNAAPDREQLDQAVELGVKVRMAREAGEEVPAELETAFEQADEALYKNVRALFGGRIRECVTGAAPIAPEILRFFYACGVPVMEGYGMTETSTSATVNRPTPGQLPLRLGGPPQDGVEVKIADDGEVLIKGPNIFQGYYKNDAATAEALEDRWLHTGDLGRLDEDGFLYITGRKKDIIITAGGKNITPANLENGLKQSRWISQAVVVGDRRPYLVALITLDAEEAPALAEQLGVEDPATLAQDERVHAEIQKVVDEVNSHVGPVEQIKRFDDPPRRPLPGDRGAHAHAQGQAQRGAREVRRRTIDGVYERAR